MKAKGFVGSIAGIPARGGVINIDSADVATMLTATSGLVRAMSSVLMTGGKIATGLGLLALLLNELSTKNSPKIPIQSLAKIETTDRDFLGICKDDFFECFCEDEELKIPTRTINSIEASFTGFLSSGELSGYNINLVDGSSFYDCKPISNKLSFLTICGEQKTVFFQYSMVPILWGLIEKKQWTPYDPGLRHKFELIITGATATNLNDLRERLQFAVENNLEGIIEAIGRATFEKYFILA